MEYISSLSKETNVKLISIKRNLLSYINNVAGSKAIIFGGGTPFYDDFEHSLLLLIIFSISLILNVPIVFWAVSSQKISKRLSNFVISLLIKRAKVMTCRDTATKNVLIKNGARTSDVVIVSDPVFGIEYNSETSGTQILQKYVKTDQVTGKYFGFTPRTLRLPDGESNTHYTIFDETLYQMEIITYSKILDFVVQEGFTPVFIPMNTLFPDDDRIAAREIISSAKVGKDAILIDQPILPKDINGIYSKMTGSFVSRIHGGINCLNSGTPIVMFAFDQKHFGLMDSLNLVDYIYNPYTMSQNDAKSLIRNLIVNNLAIRTIINGVCEKAKVDTKSPIERIKNNTLLTKDNK